MLAAGLVPGEGRSASMGWSGGWLVFENVARRIARSRPFGNSSNHGGSLIAAPNTRVIAQGQEGGERKTLFAELDLGRKVAKGFGEPRHRWPLCEAGCGLELAVDGYA